MAIMCSVNLTNLLQLFTAAAEILWKIGGDGTIIQDFVQLGVKAKTAASEAMDAEAVLGDIPDEFLDPIQVLFSPILARIKKMDESIVFAVVVKKGFPL